MPVNRKIFTALPTKKHLFLDLIKKDKLNNASCFRENTHVETIALVINKFLSV